MRALAFAVILGWASPILAADDEKPMVWGCASAAYFGETTEYAHGVLGDAIEYKGLYTTWIDENDIYVEARVELPKGQVFEDIQPRCGNFNNDGAPDPITVISDAQNGARLAIFVRAQMIATPPIGTGNRWLAPIGSADLDGNGLPDIAYVEKPHISGTLRIWELQNGKLVQTAEMPGFSNHKIGENFITSGLRDCGQGPELVIPNFNWSKLMVVRFGTNGLESTALQNYRVDRVGVANALECAD